MTSADVSSPFVQTVTGKVDPSSLGLVHLHEHLLSDFSCYMPADRSTWDRSKIELGSYRHHLWSITTEHNVTLGDVEEAEVEIRAFQAAGGSTVVDSTSIGIARNPAGLRELAERTGLNIVMGSGWYIDGSLPTDFAERPVEDLAQQTINEITVGVDGTDIRAGIIGEVGLSWPHTEREMQSLHSAAMAQVETGAALQIHPGRASDSPMSVVQACIAWGVDPSRIVMSHVERTLTSVDQMFALAETGCVLEFDLFGQESSYYLDPNFTEMPNDGGRIRFIAQLMEAGYLDQIAISQDICQRVHTTAFGGEGLDHILTRVVPLMGRIGLSDSDIDQIMRLTPARVLSIST